MTERGSVGRGGVLERCLIQSSQIKETNGWSGDEGVQHCAVSSPGSRVSSSLNYAHFLSSLASSR